MNQESQISRSVLDPTLRVSAGAFLLTLGCILLLASTALAQSTITTYAGNGTRGFGGDGGLATSALLEDPGGLALDGAGNLYIADFGNNRVRKVTPEGVITTVAGDGRLNTGPLGDGGPATSARIASPSAVAVDSAGNLIIAPCNEFQLRKVTTAGIISSFGTQTTLDGALLFGCDFISYYNVPMWSMAVDASGNVFVAEPWGSRVRKVTPEGVMTRFAGWGAGGAGSGGDGGPATSAGLSFPTGTALDSAGNLYIADSGNNRIRKITPNGIISTVAGRGTRGFSGDDGPATSAAMAFPSSVAIDSAGNLFIADAGNYRIRKVTPDGIITTVAGNGIPGFSGDGGPATSAQFESITAIAVDAAGKLFVSDSGNQRIRVVVSHGPPTLAAVAQDLGSPGTTVSITLSGANFFPPLTVDAGSGVTVDDVRVTGDTTATARLMIASDASLGPRDVTVTTLLGASNAATFRVVPPFPDLFVTSSPGRLGVGFNGTFKIDVQNVGALDTSGPVTLTDTVSAGLTYVSGVGNGWVCSTASQTATCEYAAGLPAGASTRLTLTVAVGAAAPTAITHEVSVAVAGDAVSFNNAASDTTPVASTPVPRVQFFPENPVAGRQAWLGITLPDSFPYDVSGTLRLTFAPDALTPLDDPAIQFATGGRQVTFVIPANTLEARFGGNVQAAPVGFQTGTVAGALVFDGVLEAGTIQTPVSSTLTIPRRAPVIETFQLNTAKGLEGRLTLSSTSREVTQMVLQFVTQPAVQLSCGSVAGCVVSRSTLTLDVKSLFDTWYAGDKTFGSLSTVSFPIAIRGSVQGSVVITLRNSHGASNSWSFSLPESR